jgi:hypothetical protein
MENADVVDHRWPVASVRLRSGELRRGRNRQVLGRWTRWSRS